ncbi:MAG TPA: hypothetical protein VIX86_05475 [Streptosporangiaceae bacterium]
MSRLPGSPLLPTIRLRLRAIPVALAVSGWAALAVTIWVQQQPARSIAVFAFILTAPGIAVIRLLPPREFLERAVLAIALSLSLAALVAEAVAIAHILRPTLVLSILAGVCSAAAVTEMVREARKQVPW